MCLGRLQESASNTINLSGDAVLHVSNLVKFLYTADYSTSASSDNASTNLNRDLAHGDEAPTMAYAAYFASIDNGEFRVPTTGNLPTAPTAIPSPDYSLHVEMYALADRYDIPALGKLAKAKFDNTCLTKWDTQSFLDVISRVYASTPESNQGLRVLVLYYARKHSHDLVENGKSNGTFHALMDSMPEFERALLVDYMTRPAPPVKCGMCPSCGPVETVETPGVPGLTHCRKCGNTCDLPRLR